MSIAHQYAYRPLTSDDLTLLKELLRVFRHAFNDSETYQHAIPSDEYLTNLLGKEHFTVVVAMKGKAVVGGRVRIGEIRATAARDLYLRSCRFRRSSAQGCCHRTDQCVEKDRRGPRRQCDLRAGGLGGWSRYRALSFAWHDENRTSFRHRS